MSRRKVVVPKGATLTVNRDLEIAVAVLEDRVLTLEMGVRQLQRHLPRPRRPSR